MAVGKWEQGLPNLPGGMIWKKGGIKYLGIYLGDATSQKKNWDGLVEKNGGQTCQMEVDLFTTIFQRKSAHSQQSGCIYPLA